MTYAYCLSNIDTALKYTTKHYFKTILKFGLETHGTTPSSKYSYTTDNQATYTPSFELANAARADIKYPVQLKT